MRGLWLRCRWFGILTRRTQLYIFTKYYFCSS